jgi:undecaprenyl-diphosphatase
MLTGISMDWIQIIVLSLIQGLTEFLPVSSSAHLVLPAQLSPWPDQGLAFDVAVHFGTLIAVLVYFRRDLANMMSAVGRGPGLANAVGWSGLLSRSAELDKDLDLLLKLSLATLPVLLVGLMARDLIEGYLRTVPVIATTTMLFAGALWLADRRPGSRADIDWSDAAWIGVAQAVALIPGTSRSGITITAALFLGLSRFSAARFSFLLSIPAILGAQLLLTRDLLLDQSAVELWPLLTGAFLAFLAAITSIHFFIRLLDRFGMTPYVIYRLLLGAILLAMM